MKLSTMQKRLIFTVLGLLIAVALLGGIKAAQIATLIENGKSFSEPPISISSVEVKQDQWQNTLHAIGSLEAAKGLLITADLPGRIAKIHFDAGSEVKVGDLLVGTSRRLIARWRAAMARKTGSIARALPASGATSSCVRRICAIT